MCVEVCVVCTIIRSTVFESYHRMKIILALKEATIQTEIAQISTSENFSEWF